MKAYSVSFLERAVRTALLVLTGERNEAKKDKDNGAPVHSFDYAFSVSTDFE